ncbi:unnamed protein product [Diatraea saccharalis]|uniref:Large ribosomal subunit protein mL42 n=1 Tax=Diatraea saccharalis TaxID=40085 RepID=A0A9N9RFD4_9NEOP|nr:unnamed protein product [Diatraea saccharalis]
MAHMLRKVCFKPSNIITRNFTKIAITDDGSTIVALHLEKEFPYALSRPLPEEIEDKSLLKMTDLNEARRVFKDMVPEIARKQLSTLTLTTSHRWFPRARDKRAKKTEMNRPYL